MPPCATDRGTKLRLYAEAGIREYWTVSIKDECFEIHSEPSGKGYYSKTVAGGSDSVTPLALPAVFIDVSAIFSSDD